MQCFYDFYDPLMPGKIKIEQEPSNRFKFFVEKTKAETGFDLNDYYLCKVNRYSGDKNRYLEDETLNEIVKKYYNIQEIKKHYSTTKNNYDDVMKDYVKYYRNADKDLDPKAIRALNLARNWLYWYKKRCLGGQQPRYWTLEEIKEELNKQTSATYPFSNLKPTKGEILNQHWFNDLYSKYSNFINDGRDVPISLWSISFKEEVRPFEKVAAGKVRSFLCGSLLPLIKGHERYLDLDVMMSKNPLETLTGVGLNPFRGNWNDMILSDEGFTGDIADVGKWDSGVWRKIEECCCDVNSDLYNETDFDKVIRHRITSESINTLNMTPTGEIVYKRDGRNSGDFRTLMGNNDNHRLITFAAFIYHTGNHSYENFCFFMDETRFWLMGDDAKYLTSDEFKKKYPTLDWLYDFFKLLHFEIEHEGNNDIKSEDMTFIGFKTTKVNGVYVPYTNFVKLLSGIIMKNTNMSRRDHAIQLMRLNTLRTLAFTQYEDFLKCDKISLEYYQMYSGEKAVRDMQASTYLGKR